MSRPPADLRPVGHLAVFVLGLGLAFRLGLPPWPVSIPVLDALPTILLLAGSGLVLLEPTLRRLSRQPDPVRPALTPTLLLLPLLLVPGLFPSTPLALARGAEFLAAIAAGLAFRNLVLRDGLGPAILRNLLGLGAFLALLAVAQALYQKAEAREFATTSVHPIMQTALGRAFVASDRAAATFINPNVFAGFLVLLLPLATLARRATPTPLWRTPAAALLAVLLGGFAAAGSGGATLALALGTGALLVLRPTPGPAVRHAAQASLVLGILTLVVIAAALATGWNPSLLGPKLATFAERLDYHRLGFRLLPEMGLSGIGLEMTRELTPAVLRPGEAWSTYLHDGWFQLLLELGPLALLAIGPLVGGLRALARGAPERPPPPPVRSLATALTAGVLAGATLVPFLSRMFTLYPLALEQPWLDAATVLGFLALAQWALRGLAWAPDGARAPLLVALAAFILHGFVDFDLYVPGVTLSFAIVLALGPAPAGRETPRPVVAALGLALVILPIFVGGHALHRDLVERELAQLRSGGDFRKSGLERAAATDPEACDAVLGGYRTNPEFCEMLLRARPAGLSATPRMRLVEARYLARRALLAPAFAPEAARRIESLRRPGEQAEAEILYRAHLVALVRGDHDAARRAAEVAVAAARTWRLGDDEAPFLADLLKFLAQ